MCGGWGAAAVGGLRRGGTSVRSIAALLAVAAAALVGVPAAFASEVTIPVEADTYVSGTSPTANFGDSAFFDVYGGKSIHCLPAVDYTAPAYGLLRFPLGAIPAGRQLVDARVYTTTRTGFAQDGDPYHHLIYLPNDSWDESTVTFTSRPSDGTVAPGDPHLAAFPGTDIRSSVFTVGSAAAFRDFPCGEDPHHTGDFGQVFPDPASASFKTPAAAEADLLAHLAADRANSDDGKLSLEVYTPNCPDCTIGGPDSAYWGRYVSKEDGSRPAGSKPHLTVTIADISTQASATSPVTAGNDVTYNATFTNDAAIAITLFQITAQLPPGFTYVANSSSANLNGEPTVASGTASWNAVAADLAPGEKLDISFKFKAANTVGNYDSIITGSTGFESPFAVGSATASVDVQAAAPTGLVGGLDTDSSSVEAGADTLDIFDLPLDAIIHPASTPISQQPITQQPISQQPISQQPISQQPISQQPISQMSLTQFGFADTASLAFLGTITLDQLPTTIPGGWQAVLAQAPSLVGALPQGVTLRQVLQLGLQHPTEHRPLQAGDLDWSVGKLRNLSLLALAYGATPLASLDPEGGGGALADWCATFAGPPLNCTNPQSISGQTMMSAALSGAPISQQPISQQPISQQPISQQPISQMPISQMPLQAPISQQPISQQPISQQPISQQELTSFSSSASPITQQPISQQELDLGLGALSLRDILSVGQPDTCLQPRRLGQPSALGEISASAVPFVTGGPNLAAAYCTGGIPANATLQTLNAAFPLTDFTLGDIGWYGTLTVLDLIRILGPAVDDYTVADLIAIMVNRQVLDWENLDPAVLSAFGTNPDGRLEWEAVAQIQADGSGTADLAVKIKLPPGFRYDKVNELDEEQGYAAVADCGVECQIVLDDLGNPSDGPKISTQKSPDGPVQTLTFVLQDADFGTTYVVRFATWAGFVLGKAQGLETVSVAGAGVPDATGTAAVNVLDTFEDGESGNDSPADATLLSAPNTEVQESYVATSGDVDYYKVAAPPEGARVIVHLTNLSADLDLALLAPATRPIKTGGSPGAPLQDPPIRDTGLDLTNVNTSLEPAGLQDTPISQQPISQQSINRNLNEEDVVAISPGGGGFFTIRVSGYDGAHADRPYSLRVRVTDPIQEPVCTPRTGLPHVAQPGIELVPPGTNTLFVVDQSRLEATYPGQGASVASALTTLAGSTALGVKGYLLRLDHYADVQDAYGKWDLNPCSATKANAVAAAIAAKIDAIKAANPSVKYVVLVGGFDEIPAFAVPDLTRIANEMGYASTFADNQYYGELASGNVLTDEPYFDTDPVPIEDTQFFVADLIGGRLVETPGEIVSQLTRYTQASGRLDRSTAFAEGYDFTKDGAQAVANDFGQSLGQNNVRQLINDTWNGTTLLGNQGLFPTTGAASFNLLNAHYDHTRLLTAAGNAQGSLETVAATQLANAGSSTGRAFFTVGCHSGLAVSDVIVGNTPDWAQTMGGKLAHWIGQTGYGYGDTDTVAYSEQLLSFLARRLDGTVSIGEALTRAKQDYYLTAGGTLSAYDRKSLLEATMYGLPFYGVGVAPTAIPGAPPGLTPRGATNVTSPSDGSLVNDPVSGQPSAEFSLTPTFTLVNGPKGSHYENAGQVTAVNYRPLVPRVSLPATRPGQVAHYPWIESLSSAPDEPGFNAAFSTPTIDLGSLSPEAVHADASFPSKLTSVVTTKVGDVPVSQLNVSTGQFIANPNSANRSIGTMRRFTNVTGRVFFNTNTDLATTAIDDVAATRFGSNVGFLVHVPNAVRVLVLFRDESAPVNGSIQWKSVELTNGGSGSTWTGGSPIVGEKIEWLVQALNEHGNVATSSNKARYYDAAPAPTGQGDAIQIALTTSGSEGPNDIFSGPVVVTATGPAGVPLSARVDGGQPFDYVAPFTVMGSRLHFVELTGTDGSSGSAAFIIDTLAPLAPLIVTPPLPAPTTYTFGQRVIADYRCRDVGAGIASCGGTVAPGARPTANGQPLPTTTVGLNTVTVLGTDLTGRPGPSATRTYKVVWAFDGFQSPVDNPPTLNLVSAGQSIPVRFGLGGDFGLGILAPGSPGSAKITCDANGVPDPIETTTTANSGLSFTGGAYTYVWKTEKSWKGTCRRFTLTLVDGTTHVADFQFK